MSDGYPPGVYVWPGDVAGDTEEEFPPAGEPPLTAEESEVWGNWASLAPEGRVAMRKLHPEMRVLWRWDYGFLPIGEPGGIGCGTTSPTGMRCTRDPNHDDDHASHASARLMMARWAAAAGKEE